MFICVVSCTVRLLLFIGYVVMFAGMCGAVLFCSGLMHCAVPCLAVSCCGC